jgi:hypothetical protein
VASVLLALLNPGVDMFKMPYLSPVLVSLPIYCSVIGLTSRPHLLAVGLGSLWSFMLFFEIIFGPAYRHNAIWWVFLVALYWIALSEGPRLPKTSRVFAAATVIAMPIILIMNFAYGAMFVVGDIAVRKASESQAIGKLLNSSAILRKAIVIVEPETSGEAIPYYADNQVYLAREGKYGKVSTASSKSITDLTLGRVTAIANSLRTATGRPVIFLCEYPIAPGSVDRIFGKRDEWYFHYSAVELRQFRAAFVQLPTVHDARNENLDAYFLR